MKQCPQCSRLYADETLNFCLDDGAALVDRSTTETKTSILPSEASTQLHETIDPKSDAPASERASPLTPGKLWLPILLAAVLLVTGLFTYKYFLAPADEQIDSLAVLPFVNDSGNPELEYLSDGLTESLIGSLAQLPQLSVKARNSVFRYKGKDSDLAQIGKDLGVEALLTGRMVRRGDDL